jgi:hypothetical protein
LDRDELLATRLVDGDVLDCSEHVAALAVAQPAQLGQKQAAVGLVELDALGIVEAVAGPPLFLEAGIFRGLGEKVGIASNP